MLLELTTNVATVEINSVLYKHKERSTKGPEKQKIFDLTPDDIESNAQLQRDGPFMIE